VTTNEVRYREDLNTLVKRHINTIVSSSPSKALATLDGEVAELISLGMVTLKAKLVGIDDDKLVGRVVEIWGFFWDQILTYVEGVCAFFFYLSIKSGSLCSGPSPTSNESDAAVPQRS
jgi:hypothetical protein